MWRKKKTLSFLPPWEFQTPLSLGTPRLPINLPRKWLSHLADDDLGKEEFGHGSSIMETLTVLRFSRLFFLKNFLTLQYCIGFPIQQHAFATGVHVFPILNPQTLFPIKCLWTSLVSDCPTGSSHWADVIGTFKVLYSVTTLLKA